jgi:hypothetical protein
LIKSKSDNKTIKTINVKQLGNYNLINKGSNFEQIIVPVNNTPESLYFENDFTIIDSKRYTVERMNFDASISPNGKYFTVRSGSNAYIYSTNNWNILLKFKNATGEVYWDCNSYFLGIGNKIIPIPLLELMQF